MKNNLFRKFLAVFLTGTMLAGVGCKDYDDDIDDLKGQIDDLKGKIELKADASALQTITDKLQGVDFTAFVTNAKLSSELAGYVKSSDLAGKIEAYGYQTKAQVEALINAKPHLTEADVNKLIAAQFTLANILTKEVQTKISQMIQTEIGKIDTSVSDADIAKIKTAVINAINDDKEIGGIRDAVSKMVGSEFSTYMSDYIKNNTAIWNGQVSTAVIASLDAANSELKSKIEGMITAAAKGPDYGTTQNATYLKTTDLTTVFTEYNTKISAIWTAIGDLAGRIQSIVFVPTNTNFQIDVNFGHSYISDGTTKGENNIALVSSPKAKVAFRVAPAALAESLAEQINAGKVTAEFIPEEVEVGFSTRAAASAAPVTYEGDVEVKDGKLIFTAVANKEIYKALAEDKTYAVALCLKQEAKKKENSEEYEHLGFEIVSPYISTYAVPEYMEDYFVLAKEGADGKLVAYKDAAVYPLVWNATDEIKLLDDYVLAFDEGGTIISLAEAAEKYLWDAGVAEGLSYAFTHQTAGYNPTVAAADQQLVITPAKPLDKGNKGTQIVIKNDPKKQEVGHVGQVYEVEDKIAITFGDKSIENVIKNTKSQVKITGDMVAELTDLKVSFDWKYAAYKAKSYSTVITIPADKAIDWEKFNDLGTFEATVADLPEDSKLAQKPVVTFTPIEMANAQSAQQFTVEVTGWTNGDAVLNFEADPKIGATATFLKITGELTLKGLPAMSYTLAAVDEKDNKTSLEYLGGEYVVTLNSKLNEVIYNANKGYFANAAEVTEFLKQLTNNTGIAQKAVDNETPIVLETSAGIINGTTFTINFKGDKVNWQKQAEYTYTVPTGKDKGSIFSEDEDKAFELKVSGSYTIKKPASDLIENPAFLTNGVYNIEGAVNDNIFNLTEIELYQAYNTKTKDAVINYALKDDTEYTLSGRPEIGDAPKYTMNWNGCKLDKVVVTATLKDKDGKTLESKDFTVQLKTPIEFDKWTFFAGSKIKVPGAGQPDATFNIVDKILAMDKDGKREKDAKGQLKTTPVAVDALGNILYMENGANYSLSTLASEIEGYGITVEYSDLIWSNPLTTIKGAKCNTNGLITVPGGNAMMKDIVATVDVIYTYKYAWTAVKDKDGKVTGYEPTKFKKTITVTFTK